MPLCYSNFKSFRNKSSRIFLFEQLLFSKVNKLTCKGQVGLGLDGKGWWRANTGCNQLSDVIGSSHGTSIKIWGCTCKLCQPYLQSIWKGQSNGEWNHNQPEKDLNPTLSEGHKACVRKANTHLLPPARSCTHLAEPPPLSCVHIISMLPRKMTWNGTRWKLFKVFYASEVDLCTNLNFLKFCIPLKLTHVQF